MSDKLIYLRIEEEIRNRIASGVYPPGSQLPTEKELVDEFQVSRLTISKSLSNLVGEGLVTRTRGRGSFINRPVGAPVRRAEGRPEKEPGIFKFISPPVSVGDDAQVRHGILEGMRDTVRSAGYTVGVDFFNSVDEELELLREYSRPLNDGFVIWSVQHPAIAEQLAALRQEGFPFVLVDSFFPDSPGDSVLTDNAAGAETVVRYLYELGHRRIAYLSAPVSRVSLSERLAGAVGAFARCGLEIDGRLGIIPGAETVNVQEMNGSQQEFVRNWLRGQLNGPLPPTAVFCSNDTLAVTVCRMLEEYKIRVPDEVSVVGFDNINLGAWLPVPLTTVAHDFYRIGRLAGSILLKRRQGGDPMPLQYRVPPELIVRGSTCAVRA